MITKKKAFLSYSHEDKDFAQSIAQNLNKSGIEVWWDKWEILAGDSIIHKIFMEGLSEVDIFLIVLSNTSVNSNWVKLELDHAIIKKIEGVTRIIPLIKEKCDIPPPLRTLLWVDLSTDFDAGIRKIVKSVFNVSDKPPLGEVPEYVTELKQSVGGLSQIASTVGTILLNRQEDQLGFEKLFSAEEIKSNSKLTPEEINDAIDELEEYGLVKILRYMGTAPYDFGEVEPTYALFLHFKNEGLDYDPVDDIKIIASSLAASENYITGIEIQELTKLPPVRINRAVTYLGDYDIIEEDKALGTAPFDFAIIKATRKTRQFVNEKCK